MPIQSIDPHSKAVVFTLTSEEKMAKNTTKEVAELKSEIEELKKLMKSLVSQPTGGDE
jgi:hypothetical protein